MKAEIISIGSELTSGQNLDTNAQWLSQRLAEIGVAVGWHTTIADDFEDNLAALRIATDRAGLVLITGGLGPTQDDLTREVMARLGGVELALHQESLERIEQMFASRRRVMPDRNRVPAMFPQSATPIPNARGTAPGVWMKHGSSHLAAMPGVPSEMFAMYRDWVQPRLLEIGVGGGIQVQRKINCFGAGESAVEAKLLDITKRGHVPEVGITVSDATISLRILARAQTAALAQEEIEPVERLIRERLGEWVFGVEHEELQHAVATHLRAAHLTLATAEGVTGGMIARCLTSVPGASEWFKGGVVAYQTDSKLSQLAILPALIEEHGFASVPVAEAMATACRIKFGTDLGVSAVGIAGPEGGTYDKPVGLVIASVSWEGGVRSQSFSWVGTRTEVQSRGAKLALNLARLHLLNPKSE
ncbi:competence/damage-inducible protein A [soil metagenome]